MEEIGVYEDQQRPGNMMGGSFTHMNDDTSSIGSETSLEHRCQEVVNECMKFKNIIFNKIEKIRQSTAELGKKRQLEIQNLKRERELLEKEKQLWNNEKQRITQI